MWYYVEVSDSTPEPTRAKGYVESFSMDGAKRKAREYLGDKYHDEVVHIHLTEHDKEFLKDMDRDDIDMIIDKKGNKI
jgi:hypothetical protein